MPEPCPAVSNGGHRPGINAPAAGRCCWMSLRLDSASIMVEKAFATIREINEQGVTILLAEQNAFQALAMADQAYVLETGRVITPGTGKALLNDPLVQKADPRVTHKPVAEADLSPDFFN